MRSASASVHFPPVGQQVAVAYTPIRDQEGRVVGKPIWRATMADGRRLPSIYAHAIEAYLAD